MNRMFAALFAACLYFAFWVAPSQAQVFIVATCGTVPASQATLTAGNAGMMFVDTTGKLCTAASVSASVTGFTPNGNFATLTATNASASVALPAGTTVAFQNTGTTAVSCTMGVGSATAVASEIVIQAASTVFLTPGSNTFGACIDQTGSTSNPVVLAGGAGLGAGFGGGSGGSSGAVFGPTAVGGAAANPPVLMGGTANATSTGNVQVAKVDSAGTQFVDAVAGGGLLNAINGATPAGENHIGELGSNQIKVQVAQTVTASAYSTGNSLGALMTVAGAARVSGALGASGTGGILTGLMLNVKSVQSVQVDVFLFDANPAGSTCTDKTAFVLATADFDKVVGILTIPATAANGAGWFSGGTGSVGVASYYPVPYDLSSATSLFACAVVRGAFTPAATTDVSFKFNLLRN